MKSNINLRGAMNLINEGIKEGLNEYANAVLPIIKSRTPVSTGKLRDSEKVEDIMDGFGKRFSANTDYAIEQHESVESKSPKFITSSIMDTYEMGEKMIAEEINKKLK